MCWFELAVEAQLRQLLDVTQHDHVMEVERWPRVRQAVRADHDVHLQNSGQHARDVVHSCNSYDEDSGALTEALATHMMQI